MKKQISVKRSVSMDELLSIAKTQFPEKKSGVTKKIDGTFVYININSLFRIYVKCKMDKQKGSTVVDIYDCVTPLGSLLAYKLYGRSVLKRFMEAAVAAYSKELL